MSRAFAAFGVSLAALFGIATAYVTLQPELQKQREIRDGTFAQQHSEQDDHAISTAIMSDLKEARQQVTDTSKTGPAWKLRQMLFGPSLAPPESQHVGQDGQQAQGTQDGSAGEAKTNG